VTAGYLIGNRSNAIEGHHRIFRFLGAGFHDRTHCLMQSIHPLIWVRPLILKAGLIQWTEKPLNVRLGEQSRPGWN
jgi:hypothetical protein